MEWLCFICGDTFDNKETVYEDVCKRCADELDAEGLKPNGKIAEFDEYPL